MTLVYEVLAGKGLMDDTFLKEFKSTRIRGHLLKLKKRPANKEITGNTFGLRVTHKWNRLSECVIISTNALKGKFNKCWNNQRDSRSLSPKHTDRSESGDSDNCG